MWRKIETKVDILIMYLLKYLFLILSYNILQYYKLIDNLWKTSPKRIRSTYRLLMLYCSIFYLRHNPPQAPSSYNILKHCAGKTFCSSPIHYSGNVPDDAGFETMNLSVTLVLQLSNRCRSYLLYPLNYSIVFDYSFVKYFLHICEC